MNNYEIMFIVRPTIGEAEVSAVVKNFEGILTSNGATITGSKGMGQRELAYEVNKFKSGYYFLYEITANDDKAINEFSRLAKNGQDIIRHLITKKEV